MTLLLRLGVALLVVLMGEDYNPKVITQRNRQEQQRHLS